MRYLKLPRSRIILMCFALFAVLFTAFPGIDLWAAGLFFDERSFTHDEWWQRILYDGVGYFLGASALIVSALYLFNRVTRRHVASVDGRRALFVILVMVLGPGLIVNSTLKDNFGRARPRDVAEFGGPRAFAPAFVMSNQCQTNCSFSSGDAAAGFASIALAMAFSSRRRFIALGVAFGVIVSIARMAAGAHFLSDVVTSFFIMLIVSDVLYFYLLVRQPHPGKPAASRSPLEPAPLAPSDG